MPLNDKHLRNNLREYIVHHNTDRPHQGIGNITFGPWETKRNGEMVCDERLGGLLKSFRRAAQALSSVSWISHRDRRPEKGRTDKVRSQTRKTAW